MDRVSVKELPAVAFTRGIGRLNTSREAKHFIALGFDCEYDSKDQSILSYQLSDGNQAVLQEATECHTWQSLSEWTRSSLKDWGYSLRDATTILLNSYFSSAELSHITDFWKDATIRRVSPAQVFNASHRINKHQRLTVFDLFHFFSAPLKSVCTTFGEAKKDWDFEANPSNRALLKNQAFREYAEWDAVVCARIFHKFRDRVWKDHQIDIVKYPTPASISMAIYRRHFMEADHPAPIPEVRRQAWASLWGGRAEAYYSGDYQGNYTLRDVKSLYPTSVLLLGILPRPEDWVRRDNPVSWQGLCRVRFRFPDTTHKPCLPVYYDGRLMFPLRGTSDCTLAEAQTAHHMGAQLQFLNVYEYDTGTDSLARYMRTMITQKDQADLSGDEVGRWLAKLFMNALIGKFSQHRGDVDIEDMKSFSTRIGIPLDVILEPSFIHPDKPRARPRIGGNIMPEWSALILGKARAIMAYHLAYTDTYLCSTDSLLIPATQDLWVDMLMRTHNVILTSKNENYNHKVCQECPEQIPTANLRVVRNRAYASQCPHGKVVWGATHAIHLPTKGSIAARFLLSDETGYTKRQVLGLKTAIRNNRPFFEESHVEMEFKRSWDQKRRLLSDGSTQPWTNVMEYLNRGSRPVHNRNTFKQY